MALNVRTSQHHVKTDFTITGASQQKLTMKSNFEISQSGPSVAKSATHKINVWMYKNCNAINLLRGGKSIYRGGRLLRPSSRGLCLKVTLRGQIDGISDGANGLGCISEGNRTKPQRTSTKKQEWLFSWQSSSPGRPSSWWACWNACGTGTFTVLSSTMCPLIILKALSRAH